MRAMRRVPLLIAAVSLAAVLLAGCREPTPSPTPERPTSQIALVTPSLTSSPTATPLPYPGYALSTPSIPPFGYPPPTPSPQLAVPTPRFTSTPPPVVLAPSERGQPIPTRTSTPRPTLDPAALSPADAAALLPWIEVAAEPGYRLYQVSQTPYGVESLEWSPDGRYLWIQVATSGYESMVGPPTVPLIVGPQDRKVWTTNGEGDYPCGRHHEWSPDGRALVFYRAGQMWLTDADGENARSLPIVGGFPRFSPDGRSIAMMVYRTDGHTAFYDLWLLEVNAGATRRLVENAGSGQFSWSPDGATLAHLGEAQETFPGKARLWLANLSGGDPIHVDTGELLGTEGCLGAPVWVLDGQKIVVTVAFERRIWLVDRSGNVEIIGDPAEASLQPVALRAGPSGLGPVSVSRDGYYLAYDGPANNKVVLDLRSGASVTVDRGGFVEWSRAAPQFLLWAPYDSEPDIWPIDLVDAAGGRVHRLVATGLWPALSPDGRQVAYWRQEAEGYSLWLVSIEGGEEIRLTQPAPWNQFGGLPLPISYESTPQWSPDGRFLAFISLRAGLSEAHVLDLAPEG